MCVCNFAHAFVYVCNCVMAGMRFFCLSASVCLYGWMSETKTQNPFPDLDIVALAASIKATNCQDAAIISISLHFISTNVIAVFKSLSVLIVSNRCSLDVSLLVRVLAL